MALLNNSALETVLQQDIDALTTASSSCNLLLPGLKSCTNIQNAVFYVTNLPNICTNGIPNGQVVFVEAGGITAPLVASNCEWLGLDGKVFRYDRPITLLKSWGNNNIGQLGDTTAVAKLSPVNVAGGFIDWCQVSAGACFTAAVRTNGTLWAWGSGGSGQLGNNACQNSSSPVSVVGGFTDWCQVSAGELHTLAVRANGTVWAWGNNAWGALGYGSYGGYGSASPTAVIGGFTDWCQVSAGVLHSAAVRTNGTLWTWGQANYGKIGDNNAGIGVRTSPVSVVGGFTDWCQVSASSNHTTAVRANGTLWTWGANNFGQLGDNTFTSRSSPVSVVGGFTDWCQVSAGSYHTAAVRRNGTLWTWGANFCGVLGDNTIVSKSSPVSVVGGFTDWCQVSTRCQHTIAVRTNGTIWSWGNNTSGKLGDNTTVAKSSPVSVLTTGITGWCQVSAGMHHSQGIAVK